MYLDLYKLKAPPFASEPDADFFFMSERHAESRQHVDQVLWHDEPFAAIVGPKGSGKSMLIQRLADELHGDLPLIRLSRSPQSAVDFLGQFLELLGFDSVEADREEFRNIISVYLQHQQRQGGRPILLVDDAQRLPVDVLEELHWLSGIECNGSLTLHFLLFGRPEFLDALLQRPLRALGDQIRLRHRLRGLSHGEALAYINHRLGLVGGENRDLIPDDLIPVIHRYTGGMPGRINELCQALLMQTAARRLERADPDTLGSVIEMLHLKPFLHEGAKRESKSLGAFRREALSKLVITHNGRLSSSERLNKNRIMIGRHPLNDICIDSGAVSRCHAQIVASEGAYILLDLNSTNGTFVNFRKVTQHVLRDNDVIAIGRHRLKFVEGQRQSGRTGRPPKLPIPMDTVVLDSGEAQTVKPPMRRVK